MAKVRTEVTISRQKDLGLEKKSPELRAHGLRGHRLERTSLVIHK